jgi:hypothetical protein
MEHHLEWSNELQSLERKFLTEIEDLEKQFFPNHAPTFTRIIEKKIAFLKEVLSTIETNPKITIWENERKSRDLCASLMWENVKYFGTFFGALFIAHMALLGFFWPKDPMTTSWADFNARLSILGFPVAIIFLSLYAYFDLRRRWDRFLLVASQLCKLEVLMGLHIKITDKLKVKDKDLSCFKGDEYLFKDYRENLSYDNSDDFRKDRKEWWHWRIKNSNMFTSMGKIYWITIGLAVALIILDIILLKYSS